MRKGEEIECMRCGRRGGEETVALRVRHDGRDVEESVQADVKLGGVLSVRCDGMLRQCERVMTWDSSRDDFSSDSTPAYVGGRVRHHTEVGYKAFLLQT